MEQQGIRVNWCPKLAFMEEHEKRFYVYDVLHNNPPMTPMGASIFFTHAGTWGMTYGCEALSFPYSRGLTALLYNGRLYAGAEPIMDIEEVREREPKFKEKLGEIIKNWPKVYDEWRDEWERNLKRLAGIDRGKLSLKELYDVQKETIGICRRHWELHGIGLYAAQIVYLQFEEVCKPYGIDEKEMTKFLQGYPTKPYEVDRELWRLAYLATELNISDLFLTVEKMEDLPAELSKTDAGKKWLEDFNKFLQAYGRRTTAAMHDTYYPSWLEEPSIVLATIKTYLMKGEYDFEAERGKIVEERESFTRETLAKMKTEEERQAFQGVLKAAQAVYPFNEDHSFYVEQWTHAEVHYSVLECGRRLCEYAMLEEPSDVFFLELGELYEILEGLIANDKVEIAEEQLRFLSLVKERKELWQRLHDVESPVFIGTLPKERIEDPVLIKTFGLTDEAIRGIVKPPEAGLVEGFAGASGMVEGYARVISGYEELDKVMPGDILVVPFTTPAWTPLFSKIKAVVTDGGGILSHAAICARDYGIPAVVGTFAGGMEATKAIKTGQKIMVDGNKGLVKILEE